MPEDTATKEAAETSEAKSGKVKVSVGVIFSAKELELEVEGRADEIAAAIERELEDGRGTVALTDSKGKRVIVPVDKLCYIEVHGDESTGSIGFGF